MGAEYGLSNYEVLNRHCQCSDYLRHGADHHCKHRLALALSQELGGDEVLPPSQAGSGESQDKSEVD